MKKDKRTSNFIFVFRGSIYDSDYCHSIAETDEFADSLGIEILSWTTLSIENTDIDTALLKIYKLFYGRSDLYLERVLPQINCLYDKIDTLAIAIAKKEQLERVIPYSTVYYIGYEHNT